MVTFFFFCHINQLTLNIVAMVTYSLIYLQQLFRTIVKHIDCLRCPNVFLNSCQPVKNVYVL